MSMLETFVDYEVGGRQFKFQIVTLETLQQFSKEIQRRKVEKAKDMIRAMGELTTQDKLALVDKYSRGDVLESLDDLKTIDGLVYMLYLCASAHESEDFQESDFASLVGMDDLEELQELVSKLVETKKREAIANPKNVARKGRPQTQS